MALPRDQFRFRQDASKGAFERAASPTGPVPAARRIRGHTQLCQFLELCAVRSSAGISPWSWSHTVSRGRSVICRFDRTRVAVWGMTILIGALALVAAQSKTLRRFRAFSSIKILALRPDPSSIPTQNQAVSARPAAGGVIEALRPFDEVGSVSKVEHVVTISASQHAQLQEVFTLASRVQTTIDATDDPNARSDFQDALAGQITVRLRMILGEAGMARVRAISREKLQTDTQASARSP